MSAEVLRRRVQREVGAVLQRTQVDGRRHGRVDDERRRVRGGRLEIRHRQERIRRRLDPDELHAVRRRSGLVELDVAEPPALQRLEGHARAEVAARRERDRVARLQRREHERRRRARAGREQQRRAAVELAQPRLRLRHRRAAVAGVEELPRLAALVVGPDRRPVERLHERNVSGRVTLRRMATTDDQETTEAKLRRLEELRLEALHAGSEKAVQRRRDEGRLLARERAEKLCDPGSFVELDRYVRHREWRFRDGGQAPVRRRRRHRLRHGVRPQDLRLLAGLHRLRRLAQRGVRREDLQGHGHGRQVRLPARSGSTTPAARASRRASSRSPATRRSSGATCRRRASSRRSRSSWARAPAAPSTRPR